MGPMIILAILAAIAAYLIFKPQKVVWGKVYTSIKPYYIGGYWLDGTEWATLFLTTEMFDGMECFINVSQDCTLDWNNYHFALMEGNNTITWEPTVEEGG